MAQQGKAKHGARSGYIRQAREEGETMRGPLMRRPQGHGQHAM